MGDAGKQTLEEIWFGPNFKKLRAQLIEMDRSQNPVCKRCDFDGFRDPFQILERPFKRHALVEVANAE